MNKKILGLFDKYFVRDPWKKARFYKKHNYLHSIGEDCYIAIHIWHNESYLISIGNNVWITSDVQIINHDASVSVVQKALNYPGMDKVGKLVIGDNVFIGNKCIIMPGVEIGNNCVIGAGTVVTKSIPSDSVVAGNPMKIISSFSEYADKCLSHSNNYPWINTHFAQQIYDLRMKYFWEEGHFK